MVAILVVLPDSIARWLPLEVSRVIGWAVACTVWVVTVEQQWKVRYGPLTRILAQFILWVTAALFALRLSDQTTSDCERLRNWGGRRVSNPRPPEPQSGVLPLNYAHHPANKQM